MKNELVHYLKKISCMIEQGLRANSLDLSGGQCFIISYIHKMGNKVNQSELENVFGQRRSSISSLITNLEKDGIIERLESLEDKRKKELVLTEKGINQYKIIRNNINRCENKLTSNISDDDLSTMLKVLTKMIDNMKEGTNQ
ncbi:winged helix-turn-helix transcriptional regulator [bacterium]|nr:winged helix-turn-helix transcriptional regulator [bacterium]